MHSELKFLIIFFFFFYLYIMIIAIVLETVHYVPLLMHIIPISVFLVECV